MAINPLAHKSTKDLVKMKAGLVTKHNLSKLETPSQYASQVFAMCPPVYVDNKINNNVWMKGSDKPIDKTVFMAQWKNLYHLIASEAIVFLVTPVKGLQDQVYLNSAVYLPNVKTDTIILSNFTAEGRAGEEIVAGSLFADLGYEVIKCPYKFEAEPELKYLRDNIYIGGYGVRTDSQAHVWLKNNFDCNIVMVKETDTKLYHLDCMALPLGKEDLMLCTALVEPEQLKKVEKVCNVVPVSKNSAYMGICNSLKLEDVIFNSSKLQFMKKSDEDYDKERKKNDELEKICGTMGIEIVYVDLSECEKSGAYLSCYFMGLTNKAYR